MTSHVRTLCRNSVVWRADRCHCQAAEFMLHIYFKKISKLNLHYQIALNSPLQERVFLFPCLKILLGHSNRWTLCNPHQLSCDVRSSWEGREILAISSLWFNFTNIRRDAWPISQLLKKIWKYRLWDDSEESVGIFYKVHLYLEYHIVCHLVRYWDPTPLSRNQRWVPACGAGGGG